jgi:NodT family efflux transporter outer membrane factor (OMF) lipoprotein
VRIRKERSSFLKKRTKKLLILGAAPVAPSGPMNKSFLLLFFKKEVLAFLLLSGCVVGPDYKAPPAMAPVAFNRAADAVTSPPPSRWWVALGDKQLDRLIDDAFAASPDLAIAAARLRQSRATLGRDRANLLPTTNTAAAYLQTKGLTNALGAGSSQALDFYYIGPNASWEIDLFGATRRSIEGARAQADAAQANLEDAHVSLAAEVAQDYVALRDLQKRTALARQNVDVESRMLALRQMQRAGGTASDLDVERLLNQLQSTRAQAIPLRAQIADELDRLAILTNRAPGDLDQALTPPAPVPRPPAVVAVGDPAALLRRRPDVRAAERMMAQKNALIGQRTADYFPKVELLGNIGFGANQFSSVFNAAAFSYAAAPILQWRPFDFGRTQASVNEARGERDEAFASYRKTVLAALADAETALAIYANQRDSVTSLTSVEASADRAARLTQLRVEGGTATTLDQLNAETTRVAAQSNASQARAQLTEDFIRLQKALGLGWSGPA